MRLVLATLLHEPPGICSNPSCRLESFFTLSRTLEAISKKGPSFSSQSYLARQMEVPQLSRGDFESPEFHLWSPASAANFRRTVPMWHAMVHVCAGGKSRHLPEVIYIFFCLIGLLNADLACSRGGTWLKLTLADFTGIALRIQTRTTHLIAWYACLTWRQT